MKGLLAVAALSSASLSGVYGALIQQPGLKLPASAKTHQNAVKQIFLESYSAYK